MIPIRIQFFRGLVHIRIGKTIEVVSMPRPRHTTATATIAVATLLRLFRTCTAVIVVVVIVSQRNVAQAKRRALYSEIDRVHEQLLAG